MQKTVPKLCKCKKSWSDKLRHLSSTNCKMHEGQQRPCKSHIKMK